MHVKFASNNLLKTFKGYVLDFEFFSSYQRSEYYCASRTCKYERNQHSSEHTTTKFLIFHFQIIINKY